MWMPRRWPTITLSQPLMPFGVELPMVDAAPVAILSQPLMPFGVEHTRHYLLRPMELAPVPTFDAFWR